MNNANYKEKLLSKKKQLMDRVIRTHDHIYRREEPVSPIFSEQSVEMESQQLIYLLDIEGKQELRQIEKALERIEKETYGRCTSCGEMIEEARLEAIPEAALCIDCASLED